MSESIQTESTRISVSGNEADEEDDDCAFFPDTRNADVVSMATDEAPNSSEAILPDLTPSSSSRWSDDVLHTLDTQSSIVDGLLTEIYDRWHFHPIDSDTFTESSVISDAFCGHRSDCSVSNIPGFEQRHAARLHRAFLETKDVKELRRMRSELEHTKALASARLIRQLKRKDRRLAKKTKNSDMITAVLQASSLKRREDSKIRFSLAPLQGDDAFEQWKDGMRAVARLPLGIPPEFRKTVWLSLADQHIAALKIDWDKTRKFAFNERSNPDDNKLGMQIVKDLHRTGCDGFSGQENEGDRAVLKRVLLAYARWNKVVGYCQGFNVLAAMILDVVNRREEDALKVMIYLVDHVLPESYFANNLRALSVDMAVFRDLLRMQLPQLSKHLDHLQAAARDDTTGANYEPPLTNVFTMQWFLTLFATCLPKPTALRIWDSILLEGSEVLLRTAVAIWGKLEDRILAIQSADEFYTTMGLLTQEMLDESIMNADGLLKIVYSMAIFPHPQLAELREKYTYNITPFTAAMSTGRKPKSVNIFSDEDDLDDEDVMENINCFTGMFPPASLAISSSAGSPHKHHLRDGEPSLSSSFADISKLSPGAYGAQPENHANNGILSERMTTDIDMLRNHYRRLRERQQQAHIILSNASAKHNAKTKARVKVKPMVMAPIQSPVAVNHLFIGRRAVTNVKKNRAVVEGPNIAPLFSAPNFLGLQPKKSARPRNCSSDSYGSSTSSRMHSSGSDTYEAESDYTHVDSDTDIASMIEGDFSDAESGRKTPTEEDSAPFEANNNSLNKTPAKKPDQLPLNTITINDESVTPTRTNGVQAGIEIRKSPSSPEKATDEYVAHLTYKTQKHTLTDRLSPHSPPSSDSEGSRSRVFSPFVSQMMSRRRAQNGLKLGLYSADTVAKSEGRHPVNNLHPNSKPRK